MNLLPQDILVMLKLAVSVESLWTYDKVAYELFMSPSMTHSAVKRATQARLFDPHSKRPRLKALEEFLVHGVKYAYPPDIGTISRGVPTSFASPKLRNEIAHGMSESETYVWPHPSGTYRGISLQPLYKSVPEVAMQDNRLYTALGLLDSVRIGRAREQKLAGKYLVEMLHDAAS